MITILTLYTKTVCPECIYTKTLLTKANLEHEIINLDKDEAAKEKLVAEGIMGVPTLAHDGEYYIKGGPIKSHLQSLTGLQLD